MIISADCETTGLSLFHGDKPFMVCTLTEEEVYRTWEWPVNPKTREVLVDDSVHDLLHYLEGNEVVFHHADFDIRALDRIGIRIISDQFVGNREPGGNDCRVAKVHDTQLLSHVVNSQGTGEAKSDMGRHALKPLAFHYLEIPIGDEKDLHKATISARKIGKKLGWKLGASLDGESQVKADYWMPKACRQWAKSEKASCLLEPSWDHLCETYCKQDCYRTIGLFFFLQEILKQHGLEQQYERELRLLPVTHLMEHFGLYADEKNVTNTYTELEAKAVEYKKRAEVLLEKETGVKKLNVNSGQQLASVLIKSGLPLSERTPPSKSFPNGQWKTDAPTLIDLAQYSEYHNKPKIAEALRLICGWNPDHGDEEVDGVELEKAIPGYKTFQTGAGYSRAYLRLRDALSRLHPSYNQVGTAWTRYSCSDPNGQNISKKAVLPLRRCFGPPPGYIWLAVDYSQLELRIYAFVANEQAMIQAFNDGYDFHTFSAMEMYGLPEDKISPEQRRAAKAVNFGIIFGSGPAKVDKSSGRPGTYETYMVKFPNAKKFITSTIDKVYKCGYVETLTGYRLYVRPDKPYAGANGVIQGTAGDLVKYAMIDINEKGLVDWEPPTEELPYGGSSIVINQHDELVFQIPISYPYRAIGKRLLTAMEEPATRIGLNCPVDAKLITTNWAEGEKFAA